MRSEIDLISQFDSCVKNALTKELKYRMRTNKNHRKHFVSLSELSCSQQSSAPTGDYIMKAEDFNKLLSLLPQEAQQKLPPVKSLHANFFYWFTYNSTTAYAVGAIILVVLICIIVFAIRNRRKKLE